MIILPAIDIKDGNCVRLTKGDFGTVCKVAENALETAISFKNAGAKWLHTVDLDGAKDASPKNHGIICELAQKSGLKVEVGGGIRDMKTVEFYLERGISRVILGSAAIKDPDFVKEAVSKYGGMIAVGIDAMNEYAAAEGWIDDSKIHYIDLAKRMEDIGVETIIYTDINRDGTLSGPNTEQLSRLCEAVGCDIIASGGINDINDIKKLLKIGMHGAICGKSIYKGTLSLKDAISVGGDQL